MPLPRGKLSGEGEREGLSDSPQRASEGGDRVNVGEKQGENQTHRVRSGLMGASQAKGPEQGVPRAGHWV